MRVGILVVCCDKFKSRNRLNIEDDMCIASQKQYCNFDAHIENKQEHPSSAKNIGMKFFAFSFVKPQLHLIEIW